MADDERREDLFEDLDRFFAPIRDVDWPDDRGKERAVASGEEGDRTQREAPRVEQTRAGGGATASVRNDQNFLPSARSMARLPGSTPPSRGSTAPCSIHLVKKMYQVPADMTTSTIRMVREIQSPFSTMCLRP